MQKNRIRNHKKRGVLMKVSFVMYFAFCLFAIVWLRASVVNIEYELGELETQRAELYRSRKIVVAQRASYYSSEKIENVALKRLGMSLPEWENIYIVERKAKAGAIKASNTNSLRNRFR